MPDLPEAAVEEAERLTRLARRAADDEAAAAYRERRADRLAEHDYVAREREEQDATLVCHPADWLDDAGMLRRERVGTEDAVEVSLAGPGDPEAWDDVAERNRALAERVREEHGDLHGATAAALAAFANDHYAKPIGELTREELAEFREEYFVRNAWPDEEQEARLEESLHHVSDALDGELP